MSIDFYMIKYSPPCKAVLMLAKELNIKLNNKVVDLSEGQHMSEDYLKINPAHTVPTIDDNGFILWESASIMRYLCNTYAPDSPLYPKDTKQRALVDRWLDTGITFFGGIREVIGQPWFGIPATPMAIAQFKGTMKVLDQLIGDRHYLVGDHLTIADLSILGYAFTMSFSEFDLTDYPNFSRWTSALDSELPYSKEVNDFSRDELMAFVGKLKEFFAKTILSKVDQGAK